MKHKAVIIFILGVIFYVLGPVVLPLITPKAAALGTMKGSFIDHNLISIPAQNGYPGASFFDNKTDRWLHYTIQGQSFQDNCTQQDFIALGPNKDGGVDYGANIKYASQGKLYVNTTTYGTGGSTCSQTVYNLNLSNTNNFEAFFVWKDSNTIDRSDENPNIVFNGNALDSQGNPIPGGQNGTFSHTSVTQNGMITSVCTSTLSLAGGKIGATNSTLVAGADDLANMQQGWPNNIADAKANQTGSGYTCTGQTPPISNVLIADPIGANGKPASTNTATPPPDVAGQISGQTGKTPNGATSPTCESSGFSLGWIFCPIINGLAAAVDGIYGDVVQPLLVTKPIDLTGDPQNDPTRIYTIWSSFRVIGDIFLVITLLVVVFGEGIGGGLIDAYAAKKILPRLLAAAILINLSIYLVAAAVDITNIIGGGIISLIEAPFKDANAFVLKLNGGSSGIGLTAMVAAAAAAFALKGELFMFLFAFVLLPGLLIMLAIVVTVLLRRGLIILLIILSPVAFALYCLPNTEKYFKQWWGLLLKTLMVYPIIAAMFGIANVLSVTISAGGQTSGIAATVSDLMAVIALFVPLFLIPFSFKMAGGAIGKMHEVLSGAAKRGHQAILGNQHDPWSLRNRARYGMQDRSTQLRERGVKWGMGGAGVSGTPRRALGRALNYGNLQAQRSRFNKERAEVVEGQAATGDDSNFRDLFLAWDDGSTGNKAGWYRRMDMEGGRAVAGASSVYDDYYAGRMAHQKSLSLYGGDKSSIQSALYYEWKKTGFDENQMGRVRSGYDGLLREVGLSDDEGGEMMTAIGFRHAPSSLGTKHTRYTKDKETGQWGWKTNDLDLVKEASRQFDTYGMSKQDVETYNTMGDAYDRLSEALPQEMRGARRQDDADTARWASDTTIIGSGTYKGKTVGQVYQAKRNLERMASTLNPQQQALGGGRVIAQGEGDAGPQLSGYGGVSSAPVEVQAAALRFHDKIYGPSTGPSGLALPGSPGFNSPPSQQPRR